MEAGMKDVHSRLLNNIEGRKLLEKHYPQAALEVCDSKKCGEYNMLRCVLPRGHAGEHNYVVDKDGDYQHNKDKRAGCAKKPGR
jgi:hypothetical protein